MSSHCELCNVYIPSAPAHNEHIKGKKHLRMLSVQKSRMDLANRSAFLYGFPVQTFSEAELKEFFSSHFHQSARVILDHTKGTYAILEFDNSSAAQKVLEQKKLIINGKSALAKPREVRFESAESHRQEENCDMEAHEELLSHLKLVPGLEDKYEYLLQALELIDKGKRAAIAENIAQCLRNSISGDFSITIFGSSANGLGFRCCDLDLALVFPAVDSGLSRSNLLLRSKAFLLSEDPGTFVEESRVLLGEILSLGSQERVRLVSRLLNFQRKKCGLPITALSPILPVRCPVARFVWDHEISVDLSVDNALGVNNSQWLANLAQKESRFRHLVFVLRYWARLKGMVSSEQHSMTSYALTLMIIGFLQQEAVLPKVRDPKIVEAAETNFDSVNLEYIYDWNVSQSNPSVSADDLLRKFFQFYATFSFKNSAICPINGTFPKLNAFSVEFQGKDEVFGVPKNFRKTIMNVQDPFVLTHNTTANIATKVVQKLREELSAGLHRLKVRKGEPAILAVLDFVGDGTHNGQDHGGARNGLDVELTNGQRPQSRGETDFAIFPPWTQLDNPDWPNKAVGDLRDILERVLQIEVRESGQNLDDPPQRKKPRLDTVSSVFHCQTLWKSWEGRRVKRRAVARENPAMPELEVEKKTTQLLKIDRESNDHFGCIIDFEVHVSSMVEDSRNGLDVSFVCSEKSQEFNTLCHFLKPFVLKLFSSE